MRSIHTHASRWCSAIVLCAAVLAPTAAYAGEVKFGTQALSTDDNGVITAEGKQAATNDIPSAPGEELWPLHVWAKLDKGAPGPLYIEFHGRLPGGKRYLTFRHEHTGYEGEKYVTLELDLSGNDGFNKGKAYEVAITQVGPKGPIKLAEGKITLSWTEGSADEDESSDDDEDDLDEQDALDTFAGDGGGGGGGDGDGPPPVAPANKKGCSIDPVDYGVSGLALLLLFGLGLRRRD